MSRCHEEGQSSLRYDATARPGHPGGRFAPLRRKHLRGCPRGSRSKPSYGPALRSGWLSVSLAFIGGRRSPLQARHRLRGRAQGRLSRLQVARAGVAIAAQPLSSG